jgi:hypothetical protein
VVVEREEPKLVDHENADVGEVTKAALEGACRLLGGEVEEELRRRDEEDRATSEDRTMRDILRDHALADTTRTYEHDVARGVEDVEVKERLD